MLDYKKILNIAVAIILAVVVLKIGGALLYKTGVGHGKARGYDKNVKAEIIKAKLEAKAAEEADGAQ